MHSGRMRAVGAGLGLLAVMAVVAGGCGGDGNGEGGGGKEKQRIAVVLKTLSADFWIAVSKGLKSEAKKQNVELDLTAATSEEAIEEHINQIETAISKSPAGLAVTPTAPDQAKPVLQRAIDQGVPVVITEPIEGLTGYATLVTPNQIKGGNLAGEFMLEQVKKGPVGILSCVPGVRTVEDRIAGFKQALEGSQVKVVAQLRGDCERAKGLSATEDILTANPDIKGIFAGNDEMAIAAIRAIQSAGKSPDDIVLIGFDAIPEAAQAVLAGRMDATISQYPELFGAGMVKAAVEAANGEKLPLVTDTKVGLVTKENATEFAQE